MKRLRALLIAAIKERAGWPTTNWGLAERSLRLAPGTIIIAAVSLAVLSACLPFLPAYMASGALLAVFIFGLQWFAIDRDVPLQTITALLLMPGGLVLQGLLLPHELRFRAPFAILQFGGVYYLTFGALHLLFRAKLERYLNVKRSTVVVKKE